MLEYLAQHKSVIHDLIEHIYLNSSIIDIIILICCVQDLTESQEQKLIAIRSEILNYTINKLEHYQDDYFMT